MPEIVLDFMLFFGFVVYNYLYKLDFVKHVDTTNHLWHKPMAYSPLACATVLGTCSILDKVPRNMSDYCEATGNTMGCVDSLPYSLLRHESADSAFFATSVRAIEHSDGEILGHNNSANSWSEVYVRGVEFVSILKVVARVTDKLGMLAYDFVSAPVLLQFEGEALPRRFATCDFGTASPGHDYAGVEVSSEFCGAKGGHKICCTNIYGNYFTAATLLEAANVSMTDVSGDGDIRKFGTIIDLWVEFSNMENFWSWPIGFKPYFLVKARRAEFTEGGVPPENFYEHFVDGKTLIVRGLTFRVRIKSTVGAIEPLYAIKQASLAAVILSITKQIVSIGLVFLYKHIKSLQHVAQMHHNSTYEVTKDEHQVKSLLESGEAPDRDVLFRKSLL